MRSDFTFFHRLRVRWSEVDMQKVVFNGNYFNYFDVAVFESWRAMLAAGTARHGPGLKERFDAWMHDIYVVKAGAEYHAPAHWDDDLDIGVRVARLGRSSMRTLVEVHRGDDHLISGELIYVYKDRVANAAAPLPAEFRELVMAFEKTPPETA
ncbi:MAG: acyl-CoA thioesterase [Burkholderiales bacterium]|nr:acyl-CoA thioesterase [Burkholderiales bacterium]